MSELLTRQELDKQLAERRKIQEILHKHRKNAQKGRRIDLWNDPLTQRILKMAERGYGNNAIASALDVSHAMIQLRLNRAKMTWTAGLGMSRRDFRNGTSLIAQREIKAIIAKPVLDEATIKHMDKHARERDEKIKQSAKRQ